MTQLDYYKDVHGRKPAREWIEDVTNASIKSSIRSRLDTLIEYDIDSLINRDIVEIIKCKPKIKGLYELKHKRPGGWRLAFYHDKDIDKYILLCGFRKQKDSQKRDIALACKLAMDYLRNKGE